MEEEIKESSSLLTRLRMEKEMYDVYYLRKVDHLSVEEIMSKLSISRSKAYRYIHTFASKNKEIAEKMSKRGKEVTPSDYKELLNKVKELEAQLSRERLRADFYEEMVAYGKEVYGIDLKKLAPSSRPASQAGRAQISHRLALWAAWCEQTSLLQVYRPCHGASGAGELRGGVHQGGEAQGSRHRRQQAVADVQESLRPRP